MHHIDAQLSTGGRGSAKCFLLYACIWLSKNMRNLVNGCGVRSPCTQLSSPVGVYSCGSLLRRNTAALASRGAARKLEQAEQAAQGAADDFNSQLDRCRQPLVGVREQELLLPSECACLPAALLHLSS